MPLIGTFIPQENNTKAARNASTSKASLKPTPENFSFFPKNKVALSQSFLISVLITVSQSATIHNDANDNFRSVIQRPLPSFAQMSQRRFGTKVIFLILQPKLITEWNLTRDLIGIKKHLQE